MSKFTPDHCVDSVTDITPEFLRSHDIRALTLDLDNALASYTQRKVAPAVAAWIASMRDHGIQLMVMSNAREARVASFCAPLGLPYISNAQKPRSLNFKRAAEMLKLLPRHIGMVGDQIFTDVCGAKRSGFFAIRVKPIDLSNPIYRFRSWVEKPFIRGAK